MYQRILDQVTKEDPKRIDIHFAHQSGAAVDVKMQASGILRLFPQVVDFQPNRSDKIDRVIRHANPRFGLSELKHFFDKAAKARQRLLDAARTHFGRPIGKLGH
ncbi:hypothetical protein EN793_33495 [Mesorhizobium sp. M4B.F.Ca.ET.150.01.1.1]|nr:hypothetical protein EN793_33495 [Mesorhizobium sp. M4B.F.Ca.ET.150.01.1.1]